MKFTGERFIPTEHGEIRLEHFHRYAIVLDLIAGKRVLDVACGEGYGSSLMADVAESVVGVDISEESILHAAQTYKKTNLAFRQGSAVKLDYPNESFDAVVSFETIEHLAEQTEMIDEIRRVLGPKGILIMSSPNRPVYSGEDGGHNEFHVKELDFAEFDELLKNKFPAVRYYGQRMLMGSVIQLLKKQPSTYRIWREAASNLTPEAPPLKDPVYFVAVASAKESYLPEIPSSMMYPETLDLMRHYIESAKLSERLILKVEENKLVVNDLKQFVNDRDLIISDLKQFVNDRDLIINDLRSFVDERDSVIETLKQYVSERDIVIRDLNNFLSDRDKNITDLHQFISDRDLTINHLHLCIADRDLSVKELQDSVAELNYTINEMKMIVAQRDDQICRIKEYNLKQQEEILRAFHNTRTWRLTQPLRSVAKIVRQIRNRIWQKPKNNFRAAPSTIENQLEAQFLPDALSASTSPQNETLITLADKYRLSGKPTVMIIAGDSETQIEDYVQNFRDFLLKNETNVVILRPNENSPILIEGFSENEEVRFELDSNILSELTEVLRNFKIGKVHIQQTSGFDFPIEELLLSLEVKYDFTVHDYFSLYHFNEKNNDTADILSFDSLTETTDIYWRRLKLISLLNGAERVICLSQKTANKIAEHYPSVEIEVFKANSPTDFLFYKSPDFVRGKKNSVSFPTIAVIPEIHDNIPSACSYIRLVIPLLAESIQKNFRLRVANLRGIKNLHPDIIVTGRLPCLAQTELDTFLFEVKSSGAKLIYDLDDNLLDLHDNHPEKDFYNTKKPLILNFLNAADCVWTSTDELAQFLKPHCQKIITIKNYLNKSLLEVKQQTAKIGGKFKILYMGTTSHKMDLDLVIEALDTLVNNGLDFDLNLIGINDEKYHQDWIKILEVPRHINNYPNFMQWLKSLERFDLGIAPLEDSTFNKCKSDIKFWDYTSIGVPILASRIDAYSLSIKHGKNGLLTDNSKDDWIQNLTWAINNSGKLRKLADVAFDNLMKLSETRSKETARFSSLCEFLNVEER